MFQKLPKRQAASVVAAGLAVSLLTSACGADSGASDGGPANADTLTLYYPTAWSHMDAQSEALTGINQVALMAYDTPFALVGGELKSYAGELISSSPTEVSFKLRDGVTCSDGHVLTPADVQRSLERTVQSKQASVFFGAGPFTVVSDEASKLVTFKTDTPYGGLALGLAQPISSLVCPAGLDAVEKDPEYLKTHMVGTGPYELKSAVAGASAEFELRKDWTWGPEGTSAADKPGKIKYVVTENPTTMANNIQSASGPAIASLTGPDTKRLDADESLESKPTPYSYEVLMFNQRDGHPTQDITLRRALAASVNREDFLQSRASGAGTAVQTAAPLQDTCVDESIKWPHNGDIDAAKKILTEGGYTYEGAALKKDGKQVTITVLSSTAYNSAGEYLLAQFEHLGIDVDLDTPDFLGMAQAMIDGKHDVMEAFMPFRYTTPFAYAAYAFGTPSPEGVNRGGNDDPEWNKVWEDALAAPEEGACDAFVKTQQATLDTASYSSLATLDQAFYSKGSYEFETSAANLLPAFIAKK